MIRNFHYIIEKEFDGKTISDFLKSMSYPHAVFVHLKKDSQQYFTKWEMGICHNKTFFRRHFRHLSYRK